CLAILLDTACKVVPLVVTVTGRVGAETPINCEQSGLRGVIVEETAEQHFLKHNDAGSWIQDSAMMLSLSKEVPWFLDDGTGRVYVVGARGATGLVLTVASEVFEESGRSLVRGTLDYLQGLKMLGVKRTERILPTGTALTIVGEAAKDDVGKIRIQRPEKGPFYISPKNIDQLIANLGKNGLEIISAKEFGIYIRKLAHSNANSLWFPFLFLLWYYFALCRVLAAAAAQQARKSEGTNQESEKEPDNAKKENLALDICVICLEQEYNAVFVPCGHMCCCTTCSVHLMSCPLCRKRIDQVVKTFRH
ncbi:E3 ubiquitin-protein ligase SP1-like, partial [Curcuma longa]|uniref:E3 ubiquitin-protein ligase SP1-like n=1 Tax=Curcuma longa TaxID=136217 RepID=UPI003D9EE9C8